MGIHVLPPDVNESEIFFTVVGPDETRRGGRSIRFGLGGGQERRRGRRRGGPRRRGATGGPFSVAVRLLRAGRPAARQPARDREPHQVRRLRLDRPAARGAVRGARPRDGGRARSGSATGRPGRASLFGGAEPPPTEAAPPIRVADAPPWGEAERLAFEKESLGFFITGHPLERFRAELAQWASATTGDARAAGGERRGQRGRPGHGAAADQDQEGRPDGELRARGPRGQRRDAGVPGDLQEGGRPPGRRPGGAGEGARRGAATTARRACSPRTCCRSSRPSWRRRAT